MESASGICISTCILKQVEDMKGSSSVLELFLDSNFTDLASNFFRDSSMQNYFSPTDSASNSFVSSKISITEFLGVLSSMRMMGWSMTGCNAHVSDKGDVFKCFYYEKTITQVACRPPPPVEVSPTRVPPPPVPARRNSRTPTKLAAEIQASLVGIAVPTSPVKLCATAPERPPPPVRPPQLHELTKGRVTIESGKRSKPSTLTSKQLLQQLAANRKKQETADVISFDNLIADDATEKRPPLHIKADVDADYLLPKSPPVPPKPMESITEPPLSPAVLTSDAVGLSLPQRRKSFRAPPAALQTSLTANDMQDTPYVVPAYTAPAAAQSTTMSSISPRALRAPPPIPTTPDNRAPSRFTFDDVGPATPDAHAMSSDRISTVEESVEEDDSSRNGSEAKKSFGVGSTYRSMIKSFQAKNKPPPKVPADFSTPLSSEKCPAVSESSEPSMLLHAMSMGDAPQSPPQSHSLLPRSASIANDRPGEAEAILKCNSINNTAASVTLPDEKNIQFYERNLQFFKKLKEVRSFFYNSFSLFKFYFLHKEEVKKKIAAKAKEDALPEDELEELKMKREQEEERERTKTAHLQAMGRGLAAASGRGMALTGRGGRGRGGVAAMPSAPPPPPPPPAPPIG